MNKGFIIAGIAFFIIGAIPTFAIMHLHSIDGQNICIEKGYDSYVESETRNDANFYLICERNGNNGRVKFEGDLPEPGIFGSALVYGMGILVMGAFL